jgi:hypothetical protein
MRQVHNIFLAGNLIHEQFLPPQGGPYDSALRYHTGFTSTEKRLPLQTYGGIGLTKRIVEKLLEGIKCKDGIVLAIPKGKFPDWIRSDVISSNGSTCRQQIHQLSHRPLLPAGDRRTLRVSSLVSDNLVPGAVPMIRQIKKWNGEKIFGLEDLGLQERSRKSSKLEPVSPTNILQALRGAWEKQKGKFPKNNCYQLFIKTSRPLDYLTLEAQIVACQWNEITIVTSLTAILRETPGITRSWDAVITALRAKIPSNIEKLGASSKKSIPRIKMIVTCGAEGLLVVKYDAKQDTNHPDIWLMWDSDYPFGSLSGRNVGWFAGFQNILFSYLLMKASTQSRRVFLTGTNGEDSSEKRSPHWVVDARDGWKVGRTCMLRGFVLKDFEPSHQARTKLTYIASREILVHEAMEKLFLPESSGSARLAGDWELVLARQDRLRCSNAVRPSDSESQNEIPELLDIWLNAKRSLFEKNEEETLSDRPPNITVDETLWRLAIDYLSKGNSWFDDQNFPILKVGKLIAFDHDEVEKLSYLSQLISDYSDRANPPRPLSIAVFGAPGSGKSFAVKEVAGALGSPVEILEFNLSQFSSTEDLSKCFHQIQTVGLQKKLPVVFWDEFDTQVNGGLGWLRHFLSPMQDGMYYDQGVLHYFGRAIFVFAGGTSNSWSEFVSDHQEDSAGKVPDFLSRIKAWYDVSSFDADESTVSKITKVLRLTGIFSHLLAVHAPHIRRIERKVVYELLFNGNYRTARAVESVIEASTLGSDYHFAYSALPNLSGGRAFKRSSSSRNGKGSLLCVSLGSQMGWVHLQR